MKIFKPLKKTILILLSTLVFLCIIGFVYEQIARNQVLKKYPPPGKMINVGDHKLHALIKGDGEPTVVFDAGMDIEGYLSWYKIQDSIAKIATTVSYDRAGLLYSERGNNPKTCKHMAEELHNLLKNAELEGPYILVGHSLAGLIMLSFIEQYPHDVQGVVFVDAAHPEQFERTWEYCDYEYGLHKPQSYYWYNNFICNFGVYRFLTRNAVILPGTSKIDESNVIIRNLLPYSVPTDLQEFKQLENLCNEVRGIKSFGGIPVISLYADLNNDFVKTNFPGILDENIDKYLEVVHELRKNLSNLSSNGRSIMVDNSEHYIHQDRPEVVIEAIKKIILDIEGEK